MNYIKKKIKGSSSKKAAAAAEEDDDFDPNLFHVLQRPDKGAPEGWVPYDDRIDEESEEWRAFRQLTQRVTETLTETKENLSKIVASTAITETSREWRIRTITADNKDTQVQPINGATVTSVKPDRPAPPRPPPPAASVQAVDDRFEAAFPSSNFAANDFEVKRPAPPRPNKPPHLEFDLGAEFGFDPVKPAVAASVSVHRPRAATGSLFLDDEAVLNVTVKEDEGPDPFDTSFVTEVTQDTSSKAIIAGVISDEHLDAYGAGSSQDEDDPFVIKDIVVESEEDLDLDLDNDLLNHSMDPFESFLQSASGGNQQRNKSPNPFLVDSSEDLVTSTSSNPFTGAALSDVDDDPFATRLAPNPFASIGESTAADTTTTTDLFAFDDAFDDGVANATSNDYSNPFASYAQPEVSVQPDPVDVVADSTFDPFGESVFTSSDIHMSSRKMSGALVDSFGLASIGSIPAAPSSQDLFILDDNEKPFQPDVQPVFVIDQTTVDQSPELESSNVLTTDATVAQNGSPSIDFYNADTSVVNVSGVSVELSEVSPATGDDFDGFFGDSNDDDQDKPEEDAEVSVPDVKQPMSAASGPPPRPPPPNVVKPTRPPPPKVAEPEAEKPFDMFFEEPPSANFVQEFPQDAAKSWDAFSAVPAPDSFAQQDDPFGMTSTTDDPEEMSIDRRKSGTFDTYERRVSTGPTHELLGCFETSVAPIVPAIAQAAIEEVDFFGDTVDADGLSGGSDAYVMKPSTGDVFCGPLTLSDRQSLDTVDVEATVIESSDTKHEPFVEMAAFDAFEAKFQSTSETSSGAAFDAFGGGGGGDTSGGDGVIPTVTTGEIPQGFDISDDFDQFFALKETPTAPKPSPAKFPVLVPIPENPTIEPTVATVKQTDDSSSDSDDTGNDFSVFIRPKMKDKDDTMTLHLGPIPVLAPPPKSPMRSPPSHTSPRFNPFDKEPGASTEEARGFVDVDTFSAAFSTPIPPAEFPPHDLAGLTETATPPAAKIGTSQSVDSQESPGSPLFELDDSEPLEDFYVKRDSAQGWELMLRQPSKKKLTGQRFWKKVFVTISDNGVLHLYNKSDDKDAFQELPLQACYSLTEIGAQQYDTYGKIFTVKLQYVFYRERVGVRPGQISKVTHGQVTSLGQLAKLGLPLEHSPQVSQLLKLGTQQYEELRVFIREVEDSLFHLSVHRDRALTYKTEEVQVTVVDELRAELQSNGVVLNQVARVRCFFLAFIVGMPDVELGLNDITKQGREVVGRHDIIPVVTEEWIRLEKCEFHSCVSVSDFDKTRTIKVHPPDACFFEIMRFRIRPPRNRELPLQVKATMSIIGNRVEIRADVLVPGCISRKHGQIPCEDVAIRFPLPECWIYLFRVEKHFRYGSLKSTARKPGKIKGLERIMGAGLTMEPSMIEVSTGQAKYEHQHRAIVWRVPRLPKEGQGAYTTQLFVCRMELTSYDQIPAELDSHVHVEFTMPATTASHTTVRSVSVTNPNPPEKYVKYLARHKYRIEIEHVTATSECDYVAATTTAKGQSNSVQGHGTSTDSSNQ